MVIYIYIVHLLILDIFQQIMAIYIYIVYNNFSYVLTNNNYIHICYKLFINFRYISTNNSYIQYIVHLFISNEFQKIIAIYIVALMQ